MGGGKFAICAVDVVADMNDSRTAGEYSVWKPLIRTAILRDEVVSVMDPMAAVLEMDDMMKGCEVAYQTWQDQFGASIGYWVKVELDLVVDASGESGEVEISFESGGRYHFIHVIRTHSVSADYLTAASCSLYKISTGTVN
jgi:hypothetical protein